MEWNLCSPFPRSPPARPGEAVFLVGPSLNFHLISQSVPRSPMFCTSESVLAWRSTPPLSPRLPGVGGQLPAKATPGLSPAPGHRGARWRDACPIPGHTLFGQENNSFKQGYILKDFLWGTFKQIHLPTEIQNFTWKSQWQKYLHSYILKFSNISREAVKIFGTLAESHSHISRSVSQICVSSRQRQWIALVYKQRKQFHHLIGADWINSEINCDCFLHIQSGTFKLFKAKYLLLFSLAEKYPERD